MIHKGSVYRQSVLAVRIHKGSVYRQSVLAVMIHRGSLYRQYWYRQVVFTGRNNIVSQCAQIVTIQTGMWTRNLGIDRQRAPVVTSNNIDRQSVQEIMLYTDSVHQ